MLYHTLPHTREGALLATVIAAIQRATPWLRVDGVFSLDNDHLYALCFDEHHQFVVGFDTLASWHTYLHLVGAATPEREVVHE